MSSTFGKIPCERMKLFCMSNKQVICYYKYSADSLTAHLRSLHKHLVITQTTAKLFVISNRADVGVAFVIAMFR